MTEEQIKRCSDLHARREKYEKVLDRLSNNDAEIIISYWGKYIFKPLYIPICNIKNDIKELNLIVERFVKDKIQKIDEELKEL